MHKKKDTEVVKTRKNYLPEKEQRIISQQMNITSKHCILLKLRTQNCSVLSSTVQLGNAKTDLDVAVQH